MTDTENAKTPAGAGTERKRPMTERLLASESLWDNILHGRGSDRFRELLALKLPVAPRDQVMRKRGGGKLAVRLGVLLLQLGDSVQGDLGDQPRALPRASE